VSHSVNLEALGFKKGETPVTDERITQVAQAARQMMNGGP